jgi:dTDP-4-dehydrorhamnose reductase
MMNITVIGAMGMLGSDLCSLLSEQNTNFSALDIGDINITHRENVFSVLSEIRPNIIINCAGYTNVATAEDEVELAYMVNQVGPKNLAEFAEESGATLCHLSTDYIFDGTKNEPYQIDDETSPIGVYGKSKLAGELEVRKIENHYIIRSAWLYGTQGKNFISSIISAASEKDELRVVGDQYGTPTYTVDLASRIMKIVTHLPYGTYHATNSGVTTWHEVAVEALKINGINKPVMLIPSDEYPSRVRRPQYSVLSNDTCTSAGLSPMPDWKDALNRFLTNLS